MANTKIFASASSGASRRSIATDTHNLAGGRAYSLGVKGTLAQMALTGVFNDTYYASAKGQLDDVKALVAKAEPEFLAQLAVYARTKGYMKDLPAYLCAVLANKDVSLLNKVFDRVIDNGKMLRNFVQMVRSGEAGRKSLGSRPKKLVARWLETASDAQLLAASVGTAPSLADVIRLSHPKAQDPARDAFFKYILGHDLKDQALPELVANLEAFRKGGSTVVPKVPFELLTAMPLTRADWASIARNASWTQTRMNLNTFARQGVFDSKGSTALGRKLVAAGAGAKDTEDIVQLLAKRLSDPEQVARAKVFPYQLLAAYLNADDTVPAVLKNALQDAMELAVANVPQFECDVAVLVDTSGSMKDPITGRRGSVTSKIRCIDVAALFASAILRRNPTALVVPFDTKVHKAVLNSRDSVVTNAEKLAKFGGGGTNCSMALKHLNDTQCSAELVAYVSDNESWADRGYGSATGVMAEWAVYKKRVPRAKLVCIDITPNSTSQAKDRKDCLNVGGFSDEVFNIVGAFANGTLGAEHWISAIESVDL
jgi:60 kDa SS-A/Ro ribonucleoprotein